jgi:transcriptional regulator GlxA family with amidase domain
MDGRILLILNKLSMHLDKQWTVEMMAAEIGVTPGHFHRVFKKKLSVPPTSYLIDLRLKEAHSLLSNPICFESVKEIRFRCGYLNASNFSRDFKKKFGITPIECRKQAWKQTASIRLDQKR